MPSPKRHARAPALTRSGAATALSLLLFASCEDFSKLADNARSRDRDGGTVSKDSGVVDADGGIISNRCSPSNRGVLTDAAILTPCELELEWARNQQVGRSLGAGKVLREGAGSLALFTPYGDRRGRWWFYEPTKGRALLTDGGVFPAEITADNVVAVNALTVEQSQDFFVVDRGGQLRDAQESPVGLVFATWRYIAADQRPDDTAVVAVNLKTEKRSVALGDSADTPWLVVPTENPYRALAVSRRVSAQLELKERTENPPRAPVATVNCSVPEAWVTTMNTARLFTECEGGGWYTVRGSSGMQGAVEWTELTRAARLDGLSRLKVANRGLFDTSYIGVGLRKTKNGTPFDGLVFFSDDVKADDVSALKIRSKSLGVSAVKSLFEIASSSQGPVLVLSIDKDETLLVNDTPVETPASRVIVAAFTSELTLRVLAAIPGPSRLESHSAVVVGPTLFIEATCAEQAQPYQPSEDPFLTCKPGQSNSVLALKLPAAVP
jgi:hypothetical protein